MALSIGRFARLVDKLDESASWSKVVPGASRSWSSTANVGLYNGQWEPPKLDVERTDTLVNIYLGNSVVPFLTTPTSRTGPGRVFTRFEGEQDLWVERNTHADYPDFKRASDEAQWQLTGRDCGPDDQLHVSFHAVKQVPKTCAERRDGLGADFVPHASNDPSHVLPNPSSAPPPTYAAPLPPHYPAERPPKIPPYPSSAPAGLAARVLAFLEREDAGIKFRGQGFHDQAIEMHIDGYLPNKPTTASSRRTLVVDVRLKGVWRPVKVDHLSSYAFFLPGGDLELRDVVRCPVEEPRPSPMIDSSTSIDTWTLLSRQHDPSHRLIRTTFSLEWHQERYLHAPGVPYAPEIVHVTFRLDDAHVPAARRAQWWDLRSLIGRK
ncbi:hypothetical protein JCM8208_001502 [Rhodotorula glutinis]